MRAFASMFDAGRGELADPGLLPCEVALGISGAIFVTLRSQPLGGKAAPEALMRELMCMAPLPCLGVEAAMGELAGERRARRLIASGGVPASIVIGAGGPLGLDLAPSPLFALLSSLS